MKNIKYEDLVVKRKNLFIEYQTIKHNLLQDIKKMEEIEKEINKLNIEINAKIRK